MSLDPLPNKKANKSNQKLIMASDVLASQTVRTVVGVVARIFQRGVPLWHT